MSIRVKDSIQNFSAANRHSKGFKQFDIPVLLEAIKISVREGFLPVWAFDKPESTSQRAQKFGVASYVQMYKHMVQLGFANRHVYEIMIVDVPVHLYFDLEFIYGLNPDAFKRNDKIKNEEDIIKVFTQHVTTVVKKEGYIEKNNEIIFKPYDSSNAKKFSYHLHTTITGYCFKNNAHVGALVRKIVNYIIQYYATIHGDFDLKNNPFFFWFPASTNAVNQEPSLNTLCDLTVYTRNRTFRTYGSSKFLDKKRVLHVPGQPVEAFDLWPFLRCLNQRLDDMDVILVCKEKILMDEHEPYYTSNTTFFRIDCPKDQIRENAKRKMTEYNKDLDKKKKKTRTDMRDNKFMKNLAATEAGNMLLQEVILDITKAWNDGCKIEYIDDNPMIKTLLLKSASHLCQIRGALHQGNHIFFMVNLNTKMVTQRCTDGDCKAGFAASLKRNYDKICFTLSPKVRLKVEQYYEHEKASDEIREGLAKDFAVLMKIYD